jgi:hypothetical protein
MYEVTQNEVFENNDKNENYTFNIDKMKYESKIQGKRIPKHYIIKTYDKYMDKLKRDRRKPNLEPKILKYFYPEEFKIENYEKGNSYYKYLHKKFLKEKLKQNYEYLVLHYEGYSPPPQKGYSNSIFSTTSTPMVPQPFHDLKPYNRNKPKKKYESLDNTDGEISKFINIRSQIEIHNEDGKGYRYAVLSQLCPRS